MARSVNEIKAEMTAEFMASEAMAAKNGFTVGDAFEDTFSKSSLESTLYYIQAVAIYFIEKLFDTHTADVDNKIAELKPHRLKWYINKALAFMYGYELVEDEDYYYTTNISAADITTAKVVKYAATVEKGNVVYIKVAGAGPGQLTEAQEAGIVAYFKEVKDAGVKLEIINRPAEYFKARLTIYYNPMVLDSAGSSTTGGEPVREAIVAFITSLPFNGEYRNNALIDILQVIPGVVMAELVSAETSADGVTFTPVDAYVVPDSGYFKIYETTDLHIYYRAYETVSD